MRDNQMQVKIHIKVKIQCIMQYNRNIVRVKQLLQCDANSRDGEQYKRICLWIVYSILIVAQCILDKWTVSF